MESRTIMLILTYEQHCGKYAFYNTQGSVYLSENRDMANLFKAIEALKNIKWFCLSVRDIRAFRVEDWSDFTDYMKTNNQIN